MKRLFNFKYPKLVTLLGVILLAYVIFRNPEVASYVSQLGTSGYIGIFIAGMLFSFGFTTPFAIGYFIILNPENILLAGIVGGIGAMFSDLVIFKIIRFSFRDEFLKLKREKITREIDGLIEVTLGKKITYYFMYALAGIIIASPLPDEAGVIMLAGLTKIKPIPLAIFSFIFNTLGIIIMLMI